MKRVALCAVTAVIAVGAGTAAVQAKTSLKLKADPGGALKFNKKTLRARHGLITVRLTNPRSSGKPHALEIEGKGKEKKTRVLQPGQSATLKIRLKKGRYEFYCPVGNHKGAGMEGKLIVR